MMTQTVFYRRQSSDYEMVSYIKFQKSFITKSKKEAKTANQHAYENPIYRDNGNVSSIIREPYSVISCFLFFTIVYIHPAFMSYMRHTDCL